MNFKTCSAALAVALLTATAMPAYAQKAQNTVRFAYDQVPENIDPFFNNVRIGVIIGQHVWDTLIFRDPATGEYKPNLATSWEWIDDRTLELDLREDVTFHNGDAFSADDVVYTLNFVSNPDNRSVTQQNVNWIDNVEKIGDYKVRIKTTKTFPAAIEYLSGPVVIHPGNYYEKVGPQGMNTAAVGSGPFKVVSHDVGRQVVLERNENYWNENKQVPNIERLIIRFIPDRQTQAAELMSDGVDFIMNVPVDQAEQMGMMPNVNVKSGETMRIVFLQLNTLDNSPAEPLKNEKVRQAINHAIDRQTMVEQLVGEGARVIDVICFPAQFGCSDEEATKYDYDPAKARALLEEAGYGSGFSLDIYAYRERQQTEAMVNYLREVGINANLRFMQYAAFRDANRAGQVAMSHQTWGSFSINDVSANTPVFYKFEADDVNRDEEVRDLLQTGDTSVDPDDRAEAYKKALGLISQRAYALPMYSLTSYYATAEGLEFQPYPDEIPRFWEMEWK
jgi:peptide/nickel transport system substrate-binding protein